METDTLTIADFLLARIAEDEAVARSSERRMCERLTPERLLAECAAKRRIVKRCNWIDRHPEWVNDDDISAHWETCDAILEALAAVYADHPEFRPEWRA